MKCGTTLTMNPCITPMNSEVSSLPSWTYCSRGVMLQFTSILFLFWTYLFFSHDYSSIPCHQPTDSIRLHNHFLPSNSSDFYDSSLLTCTVRCKTVAMSNPKPGYKVPCNQLWEFHFALVGTNKVQTPGYDFVPRVM